MVLCSTLFLLSALLVFCVIVCFYFFFQAEDGIRYLVRSRGLGDVYKRQVFQERRIRHHREIWAVEFEAHLDLLGDAGQQLRQLSLIHI